MKKSVFTGIFKILILSLAVCGIFITSSTSNAQDYDDPVKQNLSILSSLIYEPGSIIAGTKLQQIGIRYISRRGWGANERFRLYKKDRPEPQLVKLPTDFYIRYAQETKLHKIIEEDKHERKLTWPLEYPEKVTKIIIHHTATTKDFDDPEKAIRDIYYYHVMGRGWGDIGYNYIIDKDGNVYEGRYGGEGVVGAHAGPGNRGSIGIAILGNYEEEELSKAALESLELLISEQTKLLHIDPEGYSYFRGKKLPNIIGHGDVMPTSCPGKKIKNLLPKIREDVAKINGPYNYEVPQNLNQNKPYAFEYIPLLEEIIMPPDRRMEYTIKLQNTGTETWDKNTRIVIKKDPLIQKGFIVASAGMTENNVKPGEYATFKVKLNSKLYAGFYYLNYKPIFNGKEESNEMISIPTIVKKPVYAYEILKVSLPKSNLKINEKSIAVVTLKNIGNVSWRNFGKNRISLGTDNPQDRVSTFTKSSRMGYLKESLVKPGRTGHFIFNLKAPKWPGLYEEYFTPVVESITWLDGKGMKFIVKVT